MLTVISHPAVVHLKKKKKEILEIPHSDQLYAGARLLQQTGYRRSFIGLNLPSNHDEIQKCAY